jgi:hypothetical protein
MSYYGDIALGDTIDIKFTTRRFSTGAPHELAGAPAVAAYVGNGTTEISGAAVALTADFDGRTGLNNVRVQATSGNGFSVGTNVQLVITAGTVDSVSVAGEVIGSFSIEARSALRPTTAGRTLDVSSGGEAGLDWGNVGSPATAQTLSATTISTSQAVASVTGAVGSVTGAVGSVSGNVGGNVAGSVNSVVSGVTVSANNDKTGYRLSAAGVDDVLDEVAEGTTTLRQLLRGFAAVMLGKASGLATTTAVYRDIGDTKDRITATVDADGNRSSVTRDLS